MAVETASVIAAVIALLMTAVSSQTPSSYTNHTVGDSSGWFFNSTKNTSSTNYSSWAASQSFNLGDFLIFNTDSNQTVIRTYNLTTFRSCSFDDASDNDTVQYGGGSSNFGTPMTIPVPLTIEGLNYFFSDAEDGEQCQQGMAFAIQVKHGLGLPPSLNQPPPPPYATPPDSDSVQPPPFTLPNSNDNSGCGVGMIANLRRRDFSIAALISYSLLCFFLTLT